jgi:ABC-type Na+ efflux pump permease subunit
MSPFGKCIGVAAVLATAVAVVLVIIVLASAKVGDGIGKAFPLMIVAGWFLSFAAIFPLTSISLYVRARLKKESATHVRELGFATALSIIVLVVLGASIVTRLK